MNIALFKLGKTILYNFDTHHPHGGDNESPIFFYALAKAFPQHDFWIICRTDYFQCFGKDGILPNLHTICSPYENPDYGKFKRYKKLLKLPYEENKDAYESYFSYVIDTFKRKNITIDFAFAFGGVNFGNALYDISPNSLKPGAYIKCLNAAFDSVSFVVKWLNESMVPYVLFNTDVRHCSGRAIQDLVNMPRLHLSQINHEFAFHKVKYYYPKDVLHDEIPHTRLNHYAGIETMHMMCKLPMHDDVNGNRRNDMVLIMNQGLYARKGKSAKRYVELEKYVLDNKDINCPIYGVWDEDIIKGDSRFKGTIHPNDLQRVFNDVKYTLCVQVLPGWITAKFTEMCNYGVIPFVSAEYGTKIGEQSYIPEFLRVHSSRELLDKMNVLDSNKEMYVDLRMRLESMLDPMYTGEYVFSRIEKLFVEHNVPFDMSQRVKFTKPVFEHFAEDYRKACVLKSLPKYFLNTIDNEQQQNNLDGLF